MRNDRPLPLARLVMLVVVFAFSISLGACGSDDDPGNGGASAANGSTARGDSGNSTDSAEAEIKAAYAQVLKAIQAGHMDRACALLTSQARQKLIRHYDMACASYLKQAGRIVGEERPKVHSVRVRGNRAFLTAGTQTDPILFTKTGGTWRISSGF